MSDHIPIEIQIEIIKRLPVISVIRFSSVSKQWKSLIHSSKFVNDYSLHTQQQKQQRLFLRHEDTVNYHKKHYLSFVDDDTFPQNKSTLFVPESVNLLGFSKVVGSSHSLFCLYGSVNPAYAYPEPDMAVIWNPMIRKSVAIAVPNVVYSFGSNFGFGVCPNTCDPKIVKINQKGSVYPEKLEDISCTNWQVEVFSLSSGVWRSPSRNLPDKWLHIVTYIDPVVIDGFIYWVVKEKISLNDSIDTLISFDLTSEEFKQVYLPHKLVSRDHYYIQIFKFRESLAVYEWKRKLVYKVWIMENGASKSFTELFTIDGINLSVYKQPVFRRNGQLIMRDNKNALVVYEPCSNHINNLGIYGDPQSLYVSSYTESLLMLDQSDTLIARGRY